MRVLFNILAVAPAIAASSIVRYDRLRRHHEPATSGVVELDLDDAQPKALFRVPCLGCLGPEADRSDDEAFLFDFQAYPSDEPCGVTNVTVNGVQLAQVWNGTRASGEGSFRSVPAGSDLPHHDLGLAWEASCLSANDSEEDRSSPSTKSAQVITVSIQTVDGKEIHANSGFTISFRPVIPLELLRLSVTPDTQAATKSSEEWRNPPAHLRLTRTGFDVLIDESFDESQIHDISLQEQIHELKRLEAKQAELERLIQDKKHLIHEQMKQEVHTFKNSLHDCENISCVFSKILSGAKGAIKVVYYRFKPEYHHSFSHGDDKFRHAEQSMQQFSSTNPDMHSSESENVPPPPPPPPPPGHHNHPPHSPLIVALEALLGVSGLAALYAIIRACFCTPRARQERAASREERRNARAYRRAARHLRWRRWIYGIDQERIDDYEEKRSLIRAQEDILEGAMHEEIRMLREAHNVVNSIVQAEEGRHNIRPEIHNSIASTSYVQAHPATASNPYIYAHRTPMHMPVARPPSRTSSLPDYRSEADSLSDPPAYSDDEDTSDIVVDGFRQYTPATTAIGENESLVSGSREPWTPRSSVMTTSPRPSMETMETRRYDDVYERASRMRSSSVASSQFAGSEKSV